MTQETEDHHRNGSLSGNRCRSRQPVPRSRLQRGPNSRKISHKNELQSSAKLALVDGDIGLASTAEKIVSTAVKRFGSIDALVNNAGIFFTKPFTEYTLDDFRMLSSTNLDGFIHTTQLVVKQMLSQKSGGSVVSITTSIVDSPLAGITASVPMITKGGIDAISRSIAMEYAPQGIRVNVVAPGVVDTPLHEKNPKEFLRTLSPLGQISGAKDIAEAVFYPHRGQPGHWRGAARRRRRASGPVVMAISIDVHGEPRMSVSTTNASAEQRLKDLGIDLPRPPAPLGAYVEAVQAGSLLFLSGTLPVEGGVPKFLGRIGDELSVEDGRRATRLAALNALAIVRNAWGRWTE